MQPCSHNIIDAWQAMLLIEQAREAKENSLRSTLLERAADMLSQTGPPQVFTSADCLTDTVDWSAQSVTGPLNHLTGVLTPVDV